MKKKEKKRWWTPRPPTPVQRPEEPLSVGHCQRVTARLSVRACRRHRPALSADPVGCLLNEAWRGCEDGGRRARKHSYQAATTTNYGRGHRWIGGFLWHPSLSPVCSTRRLHPRFVFSVCVAHLVSFFALSLWPGCTWSEEFRLPYVSLPVYVHHCKGARASAPPTLVVETYVKKIERK